MQRSLPQPTGMTAFVIVWVGQFVSLLGTSMTRFAITLWAWELTGQATALALVAFFGFGPMILFSPIAGALVDRWNRKLVMMLSDLGAGLATIALFLLSLDGSLAIWHVFLAAAFAGVSESFQFPAYSASITTMVKKEHYARTSAMLGLAESTSGIFAPIAAAGLYAFIRLDGILLIDIITFLFAISTLLWVHIPQPKASPEGAEGKGSLFTEAFYGFRYLLKRRSLLGLQLVFFVSNFIATIAFTLTAAMILARSGNDELALGSVNAVMGVGGVVGGLIMSTWGGPKRRIHGVLAGWIISSLLGQMVLGLGQGVIVWAIGGFMVTFCIPLINASNQAIWMSKVAPDVQGRVFAVRRLIAQIVAPLGMLMAGPLADYVFEPAMQSGGALAGTFGVLVGTGAGAGIGLMFVFVGLLGALVGVVSFLIPAIRNVEDIIPDHQMSPANAEETAEGGILADDDTEVATVPV